VREAGTIHVEVRDDGSGREATGDRTDSSSGGSGLAGLAERVADFTGADFEAGPLPEGGFRLRVRLAIPNGGEHGEGQR
jgi:signal transduction histidine kinase